MDYLLRVVTAGEQKDTLYPSKDSVMEAFEQCEDLAMVFYKGELIAFS